MSDPIPTDRNQRVVSENTTISLKFAIWFVATALAIAGTYFVTRQSLETRISELNSRVSRTEGIELEMQRSTFYIVSNTLSLVESSVADAAAGLPASPISPQLTETPTMPHTPPGVPKLFFVDSLSERVVSVDAISLQVALQQPHFLAIADGDIVVNTRRLHGAIMEYNMAIAQATRAMPGIPQDPTLRPELFSRQNAPFAPPVTQRAIEDIETARKRVRQILQDFPFATRIQGERQRVNSILRTETKSDK